MKVIFLKDVFDSTACRPYRKGEVHDITDEQFKLYKGKSNDHLKVLDSGTPEEPAEEPKPKRGRPPKDEAPQE